MHTIILAGGFGTRLFPLSRSNYPKQFIPLFGDRSLFQKTVLRAAIFSKPEEIFVVTNDTHKFLVNDQLSQINISCNVLQEPCGKNTLPAITYASLKIYEKDKEAVILVLSSDQILEVEDAYISTIKAAEKLTNDYIVTFGVVPTTPHTGYGYIKPRDELEGGYTVSAFVEKPDKKTAEKYLKEGYLWNAGIFCFSADMFLEECRKYAPDVFHAFSHDIATAYELTPKISIDYGLLEKTRNVAVVPLSTSWNDLGSFEALYSVSDKDNEGNVVNGDYITPDGKNNIIVSDKLISTIGISDMAIIDTADVLMICPKNQTQKIGEITELLRQKNDDRVINHTTVHRPWGTYTILLRSKTFLIKKLVVAPHKRISLQYHNHRSEHWVVVGGLAEVTNGENTFLVRAGESTFVPAGTIHRLANHGEVPLEVIEVQNGDILTEEDIVRCDDDFQRK
ncbi:Alginate biosynthesis protein AlgA [bioreactor metagenome]|uniref:mannose-1-phosphate guanylyltransferase n=1 Tax=bioreactor metagenome TaxID=1076179 RepID=A0A644V718_9ZZZZ|nr:mannose-1-phosphate guanylyltransferase/mannose-6-phosphate isomerase [Methanocorpusculum sp.]